jgi:2-polyprenyl-6-methoxyphenol hydroxylase-like FAD-dependent oxidoreductase
MRIACIGAGVAGLYSSILLKSRDPQREVFVMERHPPEHPRGWGIVFWSDLVATLRASDAASADQILKSACRWTDQALHVEGSEPVYGSGAGFSIGRRVLQEVLARRAESLGVKIQYGRSVDGVAHLPDADLVIAADGSGSALRDQHAAAFGTEAAVGRNKYVWLGTTRVFDSFTFGFVKSEGGWIWFHAYKFDERTSTIIIECSPETHDRLGLAAMGTEQALRLLQDLFRAYLDGHPLLSDCNGHAGLRWLEFRTLTNRTWIHRNIVLAGDAAHTTHYSIGSGTRLALEDSIALAECLDGRASLEDKLGQYERRRQRALLRYQADARQSARWFERIERYIDRPVEQVYTYLRHRRSPLLAIMPPEVYGGLIQVARKGAVVPPLRRWASRGAKKHLARKPVAASPRTSP